VLDLVIRGGTVVDGTGTKPKHADIGVRQGRITAIGNVEDSAARSLDADGLIVAPGFIDLHTHYDAQLFWDPAASPSPLHGVTTIFGGNCGFSLAPCGPEDSGYLTRMMAKVEGMPRAALEAGLDWHWNSFSDFLERLDGNLGVNAGFLVGHSAIRRAVMGDEAVIGPATSDQVKSMVSLLHRALSEGGLGFSTSTVHTHHDGELKPVPSRSAERSEIEALAAAVAEHPGTTLEMILQGCLTGFSDEEQDLMASLSLLANRPLNWNVLGASASARDLIDHQLKASDVAAGRGATVVALSIMQNVPVRISFIGGTLLEGLPGWSDVLALPVEEQIKAWLDPAVRERLEAGARSEEAGVLRNRVSNWPELVIEEAFTEETARYEGQKIGVLAKERGQRPFDTLLDIVIADGLRTGLRPPTPTSEEDWDVGAELWRNPRTVIGGSDSGAHLDLLCGAVYSTGLLESAVRRRGLLTWEEAIKLLTDRPARLYGLRERGRLTEGWFADITIFDPETVAPLPARTRSDLPGGASRICADSIGVHHVLVNGEPIVFDGEFTGVCPGHVLRSGQDTRTVTAGSEWWE
jgi:N-acyl-D-aspartate/D-glutamate deacylase